MILEHSPYNIAKQNNDAFNRKTLMVWLCWWPGLNTAELMLLNNITSEPFLTEDSDVLSSSLKLNNEKFIPDMSQMFLNVQIKSYPANKTCKNVCRACIRVTYKVMMHAGTYAYDCTRTSSIYSVFRFC